MRALSDSKNLDELHLMASNRTSPVGYELVIEELRGATVWLGRITQARCNVFLYLPLAVHPSTAWRLALERSPCQERLHVLQGRLEFDACSYRIGKSTKSKHAPRHANARFLEIPLRIPPGMPMKIEFSGYFSGVFGVSVQSPGVGEFRMLWGVFFSVAGSLHSNQVEADTVVGFGGSVRGAVSKSWSIQHLTLGTMQASKVTQALKFFRRSRCCMGDHAGIRLRSQSYF